MWSKLEEVFEEMGLPYSRQGSYGREDDIPESLFTFWNIKSPEKKFYDNKSNVIEWEWIVYFYTQDNSLLYTKMKEFIKMAKSKGFLIDGEGQDLPSDNPNYIGRYVVLTYVENKEDMEG